MLLVMTVIRHKVGSVGARVEGEGGRVELDDEGEGEGEGGG